MGPTVLRGIRATGDTLSNVKSQVFTPYNCGSSRDRTPDLLTTRAMCYYSATALHTTNSQYISYNTSRYRLTILLVVVAYLCVICVLLQE